MATIVDSLIITLGLDPNDFTTGLKTAQDEAKKTDAEFQSLGSKWGGVVKSIASSVIAPIAGVFAIGSTINSYISSVAEVATMTGAYSQKLEEWRYKRAMLSRVTREDIELYKKGRESIVGFNIAMADLSAKIMREAMPVMKFLIDGLNKFTDWVNRNGDNIVRFLEVTAGVLTAVFLPALIKTGAAMVRNPLTWIIAAIGALVLVIDDLVTYIQGGQSQFAGFWSQFGSGQEILEKLQGAFEKVLAVIKFFSPALIALGASFGIIKTGTVVVQGLTGAFRALIAVFTVNPLVLALTAAITAVLYLWNVWKEAGGDMGKVWDILCQDVTDFLNVFGGLGDILNDAGVAIADFAVRFAKAFADNIADIWDKLTELGSMFVSWIDDKSTQFRNFCYDMADAFKLGFELAKQWLADLGNSIISWITEKVAQFMNFANQVGSAFQTGFAIAKQWALDFFSQLWQWITELPSRILAALQGLAGTAMNFIGNLARDMMPDWIADKLGFGEKETPESGQNTLQNKAESYANQLDNVNKELQTAPPAVNYNSVSNSNSNVQNSKASSYETTNNITINTNSDDPQSIARASASGINQAMHGNGFSTTADTGVNM